MTVNGFLWLIAGVLTGAAHAFSLWWAARPPFRWVAAAPLRLLAVAAIFIVAAVSGGLWPVVVGWSGGFPLCALVLYFQRPA